MEAILNHKVKVNHNLETVQNVIHKMKLIKWKLYFKYWPEINWFEIIDLQKTRFCCNSHTFGPELELETFCCKKLHFGNL